MTTEATGTAATALATRQRLLDAAEHLFADHGFAGTSMRALTTQAGTNLAAVNYHFGSKEALFEAVFARRFAPINAERLRILSGFEARRAGEPITVEEWLEAMVAPPLRTYAQQGQATRFPALLGRMHSESGELQRRVCERPFSEIRERFLAALQKALPELDERDIFWRVHFVIAAMANVIAGQTRLAVLSRGLCDATDAEETVRRLVPFLAAGIRARVPPRATAPGATKSEHVSGGQA
jgi:AcrR family transcriptional regulator